MVDRDYGKLGTISFDGYVHRWLIKGRVNVIYRNWVVWIGRIAAYIADYAKFAIRRPEALRIDEGWNLRR